MVAREWGQWATAPRCGPARPIAHPGDHMGASSRRVAATSALLTLILLAPSVAIANTVAEDAAPPTMDETSFPAPPH